MSGVVQWVAASRGQRTGVWPVLPEPVAHQLTERSEVGQPWLIRGQGGDHAEAVQQALTGGRRAPAPVTAREPAQLAG